MNSPKLFRLLFVLCALGLPLGFLNSSIWIGVELIGLLIATNWAIENLRTHTMGSDVLAILAIIGTIIVKESFAGAVITLMLTTGRLLEEWAEGQA